MEPLGIVVFATVMGTAAFTVIVESLRVRAVLCLLHLLCLPCCAALCVLLVCAALQSSARPLHARPLCLPALCRRWWRAQSPTSRRWPGWWEASLLAAASEAYLVLFVRVGWASAHSCLFQHPVRPDPLSLPNMLSQVRWAWSP